MERMQKLPIKGYWPVVKQRVKDAYPNLKEEDLSYKKGHAQELIERLEQKTGKQREELVSWLSGLSHVKY